MIMSSGLRGFLGVVSQPGTLSHIEMGWVYDRGQKRAVQVISVREIINKLDLAFDNVKPKDWYFVLDLV